MATGTDTTFYSPTAAISLLGPTSSTLSRVAPESTRVLSFGPRPGRYFMGYLPDTNTMVVPDDLIIDN
jgi:hypothetical protein